MFRVQFQRKKDNSFETIKTLNLKSFDPTVAEAAESKVKDGLYVQMFIDHSDEIPEGYAGKVLQYSIKIWRQETISCSDALKILESLPF